MNLRVCHALVVVASLLASAAAVRAQNGTDLEKVRALYVAAAYEEALAAMPAEATGAAKRDLDQYRALCLLALGREPEAVAVIERLVTDNPTYLPAERDTSPRIFSIFADVRSRLVPAIVRGLYSGAKKAFDEKDVERARHGFTRTLEVVDSLPAADRDALGDLRVVASGFVDLLAAQPTPGPKPATPASPPPPASAEPAPAYVGPVAIREELPAWNPPDLAARTREYIGVLRVVIGEDGQVSDATMIEPTHPAYDVAVVRAAKTWVYKPATRGGKPVPAQKDIRVRLVPR